MTGCERRTRRITPARIFSRGKAREVIIELSPPGTLISFRLKGERRRYPLPVEYLYRHAVKAWAVENRKLKRRSR